MLVKRLPHEDFDYGLSADVMFACRNIQFLQHILGEVDIHSLYRGHHPGVPQLVSLSSRLPSTGGSPAPRYATSLVVAEWRKMPPKMSNNPVESSPSASGFDSGNF